MKNLSKISALAILTMLAIFVFSTIGLAKDISEYDQNLVKRLTDENRGVRASAARLLGERKCDGACQELIKMLKHEECYACRIVAARALYKIGDEKVIPMLKNVAKRDKNRTVRRVVSALVIEMENVQYVKK